MSIEALYPIIKPSLNLDFASTKTLDPRITFTRASTGTYYDGVTTAMAEQNLFVQSTFAASWGSARVVLTPNSTTAPDGTNTGLLVVSNTDINVSHYVVQITTGVSGVTYTFSVFAKAAGYTKIQLFPDSSGNFSARFDLTAVTATFSGSATSANIVSVGNGWYRCSTTFTMGVNSRLDIQPIADSGVTQNSFGDTYTGDGVSGVFLWGAQLEQRSSVTAYTPTTTQPITNYVPVLRTAQAGQARFDHNPTTGESLGLLVEEQRTNLALYSEDFGNAAWIKSNATITANSVIAPDGTITADKLIENNVNTFHRTAQFISVISNNIYTASIYIKAGERNFAQIRYENAGSTQLYAVSINLLTREATTSSFGNPVSTNYNIENIGNGWLRVSLTVAANNTTFNFYAYSSSALGIINYQGDGYSGIYLWGAQLEAGSFATSYIQTVASQVTRSGDAASITGTNFSQWYNQGEGTVCQNFTAIGISALDRLSMQISDGGTSFTNDITFRNYNGANVYGIFTNSVAQTSIIFTQYVVVGVENKLAAAYKTNDIAASKDAGTVQTDSSAIIPVVNRLNFPSNGCNYIKKLAYYPYRQSNTQIQALTS